MPYLINSIVYLTHEINTYTNLINNNIIYIQSQLNNNKMFEIKKIYESNNHIEIEKVKKPKKKLNNNKKEEESLIMEKCMNKINIFNELDKNIYNI